MAVYIVTCKECGATVTMSDCDVMQAWVKIHYDITHHYQPKHAGNVYHMPTMIDGKLT